MDIEMEKEHRALFASRERLAPSEVMFEGGRLYSCQGARAAAEAIGLDAELVENTQVEIR